MANKLPQFEANQVLSNEHLNQVVQYLEEQSRLTRNHLLGSGIISGFEVKRVGTGFNITEGAAVSSNGYLMLLQTDNWQMDNRGNRFIGYDKMKKFEPKSLLFPFDTGVNNTSNSYLLFNGLDSANIFQLIETTVASGGDPNITPLPNNDLNQHIVVLFLQIQVKELKSCEADSCMELGREWTYTVIPLLLSKTDADKLIQNEYMFNPVLPANTDLDPYVNPVSYLTDIPLIRPDFSGISENISSNDLADIYRKVLLALQAELTDVKYLQIDKRLQLLLQEGTSYKPIDDLKTKIDLILGTSGFISRTEYFQYAYDFIKDYVDAYHELQDAAFEYHSYVMPSVNSFPHHVRLGMMPDNNKVVNSDQYPPTAYRHGFTSARNVEKQKEAFKNLQVIVNRLSELNDSFTTQLNVNDIRLTPSKESAELLSQKSIPFYYGVNTATGKPPVVGNWSPALHRKGKINRLLNYYDNSNTSNRNIFLKTKDTTTDEQLYLPLLYKHESYDFYKVEGHIGAAYPDVFKTLSDYISDYNLSFDIQLVRLNKNTVMLLRDKHILFNDLESLYNVISEEIRSLLTTELNYFSNIRVTRRPVRKIDTVMQPLNPAVEEIATTPQLVAASKLEEPKFYKANLLMKTSVAPAISGVTREYQTLNLGVKDSAVSLQKDLGLKLTDVINVIGGSTGISVVGTIATPAAPYVGRVIASINALMDVLSFSFDQFSISDYNDRLSSLDAECRSFVLFAKNQAEDTLQNESNIIKAELLDYLNRILYECDFDQIPAIEKELERRAEQVGVNTYLQQYVNQNSGIEHRSGVWKSGTFIVVFDEKGTVVGDFCLPYRCCAGNATTQYVLAVVQTIWLDGQVLDNSGKPVDSATVLLNNEQLPVDKNGRFRKTVSPDTFLVLNISADGFEPRVISLTSAHENMVQNITLLTKAQEPKINLQLKVTDSTGKALAAAEVKLGDDKLALNNNGEFKGQVKANNTFSVSITLQGYRIRTETLVTKDQDMSLEYKLIKIVTLKGTIVDFNNQKVLNASVLINDTLIQVNDNTFTADLDDSSAYKLTVSAKDLQTFMQDINTGFTDINLPVTLQKVATFSVRVGVYISSKQVTPVTPTQPATTVLSPTLLRNISVLRSSSTLGRVTTLQPTISRLATTVATTTGGTSTPVNPPDSFSFMGKDNAASSVNDVPQTFNDNLKLYESQEVKGKHRLVITELISKMNFVSALVVEDRDVLVLIPAEQGYTSDAQFSYVIGIDGGAQSVADFNKFMSDVFGVPAGQAVVTGSSVDVRLFKGDDGSSFANLLTTHKIKFTSRIL